ncbi:MAG: primosomal protein N', partial [Eubacteriales bacterium]
MATKPYAEIIVDVTAKKLDRIFHYRVPQALSQCLAVGMRVIVPFGKRTVEGYILGFCDTPEVVEIRDIIDIIEDEPMLNRDLLALAGWISERYMCSVVDAIHSMMPAGARMVGYKYIVPVNLDLTSEKLEDMLTGSETEVYNYIVSHRKTLYNDVRKVFGDRLCRFSVKKLTTLGLVEGFGEMKAKAGPRLIQTIGPALPEKELAVIITGLAGKAPRQAAVLKAALDRESSSVRELAAAAGTTPGTVRELVKKGYLVSKETQVFRDPYGSRAFEHTEPLSPTRDQSAALKEIIGAIGRGHYETFLLNGVTGSGKTEVYLQAIAYCLAKDREAIVLVPEISLTPQMVERFKGRFGSQVAVLHSRLSTGERYDEWTLIKEGRVKVVVGARSAVFAPFTNLGLIIVDEEHETSYKQEDSPKYHAREVAVARARLCSGVVVLGSATPSLESYTRAVAGKYRLLDLDSRVQDRPLPAVEVIDLREEMHAGHRSIFSRRLIEKIKGVLERQEQIILFLNRRGYSTFVVCRDCGLVMKCPKCSITLTLHAGANVLRCHYCDFSRKAPEICPKCASKSIRHFGVGTQKVEEEAARWFPEARVARMDMDTTTGKGSHERILNSFKEGKVDILVGTQMIAKGLDFPRVTLVGVITADTALNLPDFRAAERTFQLLTQVAGRAGRGSTPG